MLQSIFKKFARPFTAVIATTAMITAGLTPAGAFAAASANSALYASASYTKSLTLGSAFSGTGTVSGADFSTTFYAKDLASFAGQAISYSGTVSGATGTSTYSNGDISFYSNADMDWSHEIQLQSNGTLYPTGTNMSQTPTSIVIPDNAVAMSLRVTTSLYPMSSSTINLATISPVINFAVKYGTATQNFTTVATQNLIPSTGLVNVAANTTAWVNGITGAYSTDSDTVSESSSLFTCVNTSSVSGSTTLTSIGKNSGTSVSGMHYEYANWDDYTTSTQQWNVWVRDISNSAVADLSNNTFSSLLTGSQILVSASYDSTSYTPLSAGTRSWDLAVQNGSSQDLTTPCVLPTPTEAPTATLSNSQMSISAPTWSSNGGPWKYVIYAASDTSMTSALYSGTSYSSQNATVSSGAGLPTGTPLVARYVKTFNLGRSAVTSSAGPASSSVTIPASALSVTSQISNGDDPGMAKFLTPNNQWIDYSSAVSSGNGSPTMWISDGNQGYFTVKTVGMGGQTMYHVTSSGVDQTFAGTGPGVTLAVAPTDPSTGYPMSSAMGWYGSRNKWVAAYGVDTSMNPFALTDFHDSFVLKTGTIGSATVTTTTVSETAMNNFCNTQVSGSRFTGSGYEVISAPLANPVIKFNCDVTYDGMYAFTSATVLASISTGASPVITSIYKFNNGGSSDKFGGFPRYLSGMNGGTSSSVTLLSAYPNASAATDTALAFYAVSATASGSNGSATGTLNSLKLVRVKMNGSTTVTDNPVTIPDQAKTVTNQSSINMAMQNVLMPVSSMVPALPAMSGGTSLLGLKRFTTTVNNVSTTTWKLMTLNAGTGVFDDGQLINIDTDSAYVGTPMFSWINGGQVVTGTGKVLLQRYSSATANNVTTYNRGQAQLDLSSLNLDSGEAITYTQPMSASGIYTLIYVDAQGRMNMLGTMDNKKFGWIRWNSNVSNSSLPAGVTITGQDNLFVVSSTAGKVTFTGTGLAAVTSAKVGGNTATVTSKAATKLVLTVPKNLSGAQTVQATFTGGVTADIATITYVSAKQAQTITDVENVTATWSGVQSKTTQEFPATTSVGLPTTIKVDKAAVCSVSGQTVTMNTAGTCVVTVSSAGDLGTNAASQTTTIVVNKRDKGNVSSIISAITAAATTWAGEQQSVTLPTLITSIGLGVTVTVSPAAVCSISGVIVTLKAAGTCAVAVTGASDAGTDAIAKSTTNIVIAKGDLNLTAETSFTLSNNPADENNTRGVDAEVADGAANIVDYTYVSSDENICTVDDNGVVTGVAVGTCTITTDAEADANWLADEVSTTVTVEDSATAIPDTLPEVGDGNVSPKGIVNNKTAFVVTNDKTLLVKWDKAAGLLTLQSTGIYIGFIKAEVTFTKNGTTYTCSNVFGTTTAMPSNTAAKRKAAMKTKTFTAGFATCKDASNLSVPVSIDLPADFAKIKKVTKAAGNATTAGTTKYEAAGLTALKNFVGNVTIKVTRYRAWPTTMKNVTPGAGTAAKKIPATIRTTVINLQ